MFLRFLTGIASAAGIAASMGAGLLDANRAGGTVKRAHCGWAAHCGVAAADVARPAARDPRRLALAALVRCVEDEGCSASFRTPFPPSCA